MILLYLLIVLLYAKYLWSQRKFYVASYLLDGPPALPIFGNAFLVQNVNKIFETFRELRRTYKSKLIRFWLGHRLFVYTDHPEMVEAILTSSKCLNKGESYQYLATVLGDGLITLKGDDWKGHRKLLNPSFQYNIVNNFINLFNRHTRNFVTVLDTFADGQTFDLFEPMKAFTTDVVLETTIKTKNSDNRKFLKAVDIGLKIAVKRMFQFWYRQQIVFRLSKFFKEQTDNVNYVFSTIRAIHKSKKMEMLDTNIESSDSIENKNILIHRVLQLEKDNLLEENEVVDEMVTVILAGYETSAVSTTFICLVLAMHQDIQQRLYDEVLSVFPEKNAEISLDDINLLPYLDLVIKESMRLYPPVPFLTRYVTEDIELENVSIPVGTEFLINIYQMHRIEEHFNIKNPDEFNTDNFLPENIEGRHPFAYIPFSSGQRNCIGMRYAKTLLRMAIIRIVRNFRITTKLRPQDLHFKMHITMELTNKHLMEFHRRE